MVDEAVHSAATACGVFGAIGPHTKFDTLHN